MSDISSFSQFLEKSFTICKILKISYINNAMINDINVNVYVMMWNVMEGEYLYREIRKHLC